MSWPAARSSILEAQIAERSRSRTTLATKDSGQELIQIFIRTLSGRTICKRTWKGKLIKDIKYEIQAYTGIPINMQSLLYAGQILQDQYTVHDYGFVQDSTIILSTRLRGGSFGSSSKGTTSFKDAVKGKGEANKKPTTPQELPGPYIVEQKMKTPVLTITLPEVNEFYIDFSTKVVI